ncbi:class II aldolase/adducin family protein [Auraticoccus monumenti]|uniref:Class II Aldolase and Adducin N-terminal domain-containing protein n=1 Tax=Auraticoccus monumenti TaxID=675864 RepID=A0A1G6TYM6_9ACTN|nr:class II aldolase/adducin family protein [Auraticoccus monumenti]SDD34200.1 Class II Aldolase and Adducin N-terminal domain-containing protein [Auraticoccus monumenti]
MAPEDTAAARSTPAPAVLRVSPETQVRIARARDEVVAAHTELGRRGLTGAGDVSVSARVVGADLLVITPSPAGAPVGPESLLLCDLDARPVADLPGLTRASAPAAARHAEVYTGRPDVGGVVLVPSLALLAVGPDAPEAARTAAASHSLPAPGAGEDLHRVAGRVPPPQSRKD